MGGRGPGVKRSEAIASIRQVLKRSLRGAAAQSRQSRGRARGQRAGGDTVDSAWSECLRLCFDQVIFFFAVHHGRGSLSGKRKH